jgi:spore coat polysaccharide biosynthesis protein SpsF
MKDLLGQPMIKWQIDTILRSDLGELVVATSTDKTDDILVEYLNSIGVNVHRGSLLNVYKRFRDIVISSKQSIFMRLTADCPLIDLETMYKVFDFHIESKINDYTCNTMPPTYPDGLDTEVFNRDPFLKIGSLTMTPYQIEHATPGFYQNQGIFLCGNVVNDVNLSNLRWTVDVLDDFLFVEKILKTLSHDMQTPSFKTILQYLDQNPSQSRKQVR